MSSGRSLEVKAQLGSILYVKALELNASSLAGRKKLCASVAAFLNLPASERGRMAAGIRVERG